jgi:hypothetical protein
MGFAGSGIFGPGGLAGNGLWGIGHWIFGSSAILDQNPLADVIELIFFS